MKMINSQLFMKSCAINAINNISDDAMWTFCNGTYIINNTTVDKFFLQKLQIFQAGNWLTNSLILQT